MSHYTSLTGPDPTTKKEIFGWYLYNFASEPFIVSAVSTYVPLLLEKFARANGVLLSDKSTPCVLSPGEKCVVYLTGAFIDTSSFALYTFSTSVFIQMLLVVTISGAADKGHYKKILLIVFGAIGSLATIAISLLQDANYYAAGLLAIIGNCAYGVVNVCGNSFLPVLVDNHPDLNEENKNHLTTEISGFGSSLGYMSALLVQIISMGIVKSTDSIQSALLFVGCWWFCFQVPLVFLLQARNSVNEQEFLAAFTGHTDRIFLETAVAYARYGWYALAMALRHARYLKDVCIFLVAWFIISDSLTSINSTAILFANSELHMKTTSLILVSILTVIAAIIGASYAPQIQKRNKMDPKHMLMIIIAWASVIPFYGLLGFYFRKFGLTHPVEMYFLAVWYGFAMGGLSAVSRGLFSLIIPRGKDAVFFSLFAVTDKGSSILGPMIIGMITDKTHNIRYAFYFLFALLVISLPIINLLDVERGKIEAQELALD